MCYSIRDKCILLLLRVLGGETWHWKDYNSVNIVFYNSLEVEEWVKSTLQKMPASTNKSLSKSSRLKPPPILTVISPKTQLASSSAKREPSPNSIILASSLSLVTAKKSSMALPSRTLSCLTGERAPLLSGYKNVVALIYSRHRIS